MSPSRKSSRKQRGRACPNQASRSQRFPQPIDLTETSVEGLTQSQTRIPAPVSASTSQNQSLEESPHPRSDETSQSNQLTETSVQRLAQSETGILGSVPASTSHIETSLTETSVEGVAQSQARNLGPVPCTSAFTSQNQPPEPGHSETSQSSQLPDTSVEGVDQTWASILDSINSGNQQHSLTSILGPAPAPRISGDSNILGATAAAAGTTVIRGAGPGGPRKGSAEWYDIVTEGIGLESLTLKMAESSSNMDISSVSSSRSSASLSSSSRTKDSQETEWETSTILNDNYPSLLSTLRGRQSFSYQQVRKDGRLTMTMTVEKKKSNKLEIVRTVDDQGEPVVKMFTYRVDQEGRDDQKDRDDDMEGGSDERKDRDNEKEGGRDYEEVLEDRKVKKNGY